MVTFSFTVSVELHYFFFFFHQINLSSKCPLIILHFHSMNTKPPIPLAYTEGEKNSVFFIKGLHYISLTKKLEDKSKQS